MKTKPITVQQWRHCPACRKTRPTKTLGRVVVRAEHLDVVECAEPACGLRWCVSARLAVALVGDAA